MYLKLGMMHACNPSTVGSCEQEEPKLEPSLGNADGWVGVDGERREEEGDRLESRQVGGQAVDVAQCGDPGLRPQHPTPKSLKQKDCAYIGKKYLQIVHLIKF